MHERMDLFDVVTDPAHQRLLLHAASQLKKQCKQNIKQQDKTLLHLILLQFASRPNFGGIFLLVFVLSYD